MRLYRLTQRRYLSEAFKGGAAARFAGRWNLPGRFAVYAAASLALGLLELVVQSPDPLVAEHSFFRFDVDDDLLERLDPRILPHDWRTISGRDACRQLGEAWRARGDGLGLVVPSAVLPEAFDDGEVNVVINPLHPGFGALVPGQPFDLNIDRRLVR